MEVITLFICGIVIFSIGYLVGRVQEAGVKIKKFDMEISYGNENKIELRNRCQ
jgi:hypothetical protein